MAPYLALLIAFGLIPFGYAIVASLQTAGRYGFDNYTRVIHDFRFLPSVTNVLLFLAIWLPLMVVGVLGLALCLHARPGWFSASMRLIYFVPGAITGSAAVMLWLLIVEPTVSPFRPLLDVLGFETKQEILQSSHLPYLFALMAFTTGAGNWIVIMYGAMQGISKDILESAELDGCNAWTLATRIKLPLLRKYVVYMLLLNFALGVQIFVEPQLVHDLTPGGGASSPWWSANQLAYEYFFRQADLGGTAALSVLLLLASLAGALLIVFKTKLFETEVPNL